jgi:RNA recognition motif. (a.k.a. RRM, RBD, or RNP domain)
MKRRKDRFDKQKQLYLLLLLRWWEIFHLPMFDHQKMSYLFVNLILLLEIIFSWFGVIISCQVIRDKHTGKYTFIEYDKLEDGEQVLFSVL